MHQQCVALVSVASVASRSSPAQLDGQNFDPMARARLLDRLLFDMTSLTGSLPSPCLVAFARRPFRLWCPSECAALHQCVALVRVASVASQSSLAQLDLGRIVNPVPRARLLDRLLFDMPIFAGSRPSNGALRATFALAKPTHKTRYGFPSGRAAVHQQCVALVSVASVASRSSPAQLDGQNFDPMARARLLDRLLFDMTSLTGSLPSPCLVAFARRPFRFWCPSECAALHQCVALVRVASVASQSSLAQLDLGRIVNPVPRASLLERLLFDMPIFAGSRPSNGALRATFALAKPTHKSF